MYSDEEIRALFLLETGQQNPWRHKTPMATALNGEIFAGRLPKRYREVRFPSDFGPDGQDEEDD